MSPFGKRTIAVAELIDCLVVIDGKICESDCPPFLVIIESVAEFGIGYTGLDLIITAATTIEEQQGYSGQEP